MQVFNIGSGTETSLRELAEALQKVMGSDLPLEFGPPRGVNSVTRRLADVSLADKRLGWRAEVDLEEGLAAAGLVVAGRARSGLRVGGWSVPVTIPVMRPWLGEEEAAAAAAAVVSGLDSAGPAGSRVRAGIRRSDRYSGTRWRSRLARRRCTWRCSRQGSALATTW